MSPEHNVQHLARIVTANSQFTAEAVYDAMTAADVPLREADLAYKFTETAWGRLLLDGLGITFADDYYWLNGSGDVVDSGKLSAEPHFIAATRLGKRYGSEAGFKRLAVGSSEVHAVNDLLNTGSRPEDVALAPLVLFLEPPTDAGMDKARRFMTDLLSRREPNVSDGSQSPPTGQPYNKTLERTGGAEKRSWFQRLFGRGPGR